MTSSRSFCPCCCELDLLCFLCCGFFSKRGKVHCTTSKSWNIFSDLWIKKQPSENNTLICGFFLNKDKFSLLSWVRITKFPDARTPVIAYKEPEKATKMSFMWKWDQKWAKMKLKWTYHWKKWTVNGSILLKMSHEISQNLKIDKKMFKTNRVF